MDYILVIDDSITNQVFLDALLTEEGYRVESVSSADEALAKIVQEKPRLILLDLLMPKVNGLEMLERLRENSDTAVIPVMVISAVDEPEYRQKCLNLGVKRYFPKPIEISELVSAVARVMQA